MPNFPQPVHEHAAENLAAFAHGLSSGAIPEVVRRRVALHTLDTLGCALASMDADWAAAVLDPVLRWGGAGGASVVGTARRVAAPMAALANGALAHGHDFDDTHAPSITHASAVVLPAVLALAEEEGLDGGSAIAAAVAGYEVIARLGMAAPGRFHARGWHATPACGTFAAAVAAGRCLGLGRVALTSALGIAASCASGLLEFLEDGSSVKRLHPGWAAHSGVLAAAFAKGGFTGPASGIEGRFGFFRAALGEAPDLTAALATLGTRWETLEVAVKPYPCCHYNHAYLDAALRLRAEHALTPDAIAEVECVVPAGEIPIVCEPAAVKRAPRTDYDAKFSLPFTVAAALLEGRVGVSTFDAERRGDPALLAPRRACALYRGPGLALPEELSGPGASAPRRRPDGGGPRAREPGRARTAAHRVRGGGEVPRQRGTDPAWIPAPRDREGRAGPGESRRRGRAHDALPSRMKRSLRASLSLAPGRWI